MGWLFNTAYLAALVGALPYLAWQCVRRGKYRAGWREKFFGAVPLRPGTRPCLWVHGVSVGEVLLLEPFVRAFQRRFPTWECVLSTTTRTGYQVAMKRHKSATVVYCPLDFTWAVRAALDRVRPDVLVLAELELWPNWIREARRRGVAVAVVNGRLGDRSYRGYRWLRPLLQPVFAELSAVAAQDALYAHRFEKLGCPADAVRVTGSLKFDGVLTDRYNEVTDRFRRLWQVTSDEKIWIAGSTQHPEELIALDVFTKLTRDFPQLRGIIVPRHPERFEEVARRMAATGLPWIRRSQLPEDGQKSRLLLVDTVGELRYWWGLADVAFVGGSLGGRGGQNMLEPAAYGAAVCFGPNTWNFRDVVRLLLAHDAAVVVRTGFELEQFVRRALTNRDWREQLGQRAQQLVRSHQGATEATLDFLQERIGVLHGRAEQEAA